MQDRRAMAATRNDIRDWLERGRAQGATHMLVVCDSFDWEDYPVYRTQGGDKLKQEVERYSREHAMQMVMEVYRIDMDWESQLGEVRAFNY